ncbi:TauD/TfdA family dioxygenase [Pseudonocardia sp.]|uniref:TauD/TfdA family dioxygenase n=1 Tax=Pseudonocardia sp. TaxID=60912 RepID=UPI002F404569
MVPTIQSVNSVVEVGIGNERLWWSKEGGQICAALVDHYGRDVSGSALGESADPAGLRSRLRRVAPGLSALCDRIRAAFDDEMAAAVLVPALGLAGVEVDQARKAVFALAALLGDPSANDPFEHVVWDVRNHGEQRSGHTSFSENDHKADYHTDNGAFAVPERFFLLYAVQAASCGGGVSILRDIRVVKQQLELTPQGRAVVRVLTETRLPKRIPQALHTRALVAADGYQYTPVFADLPMVRWRTHGLYRGLADRPDYDTVEVRAALDTVRDLLENGGEELRRVIPTDGLLLVNNHIALHGRSAFTDPARHLLRLRFHEPSA